MSRKWSRMVNKNTKSINQLRKKQGKKPVYGSSSEDGQVVKCTG
jgi:hypothetical protein